MSSHSLRTLYADEMQDLCSANDQMAQIVEVMSERAQDADLKRTLQRSLTGIRRHAATLKDLLANADEQQSPERCMGMAGLVKEATKHLSQEPLRDGELRDIVIIAQYQRMSHYGLAGFGTAAAYAHALGMPDHASQLQHIVSEIYGGDEYASSLAKKAEDLAAKMAN